MSVFAVVILVAVDIYGPEKPEFRVYTTVAFIIGGLTSVISGYIGM
jgi:Na+/H+-translocating membrane pyrophosphatase